ncbi:Protein trichome birefringence [Heracleum sosnowskyi]|uniref:Protein trichome birefringence n=1 Tax=Heracleum sosnowskyi TaxID=360622 RepID=A0AAD8IVA7_9APIA|nr:Protein trichome birefringence [Heracleum sosnowskyi]
MSDSPTSRTRSVLSLERSNNNNTNNHFFNIFATRRSTTFACTITVFFILSTIFFVFSHLTYNSSPVFVRYIIENRSHLSTFFSQLFPTTTANASNFYPDTKALSTNVPPMNFYTNNASSPEFSPETGGFSKRNNESVSDLYTEYGTSDLISMVNSSAKELERLIKCDLFNGSWVEDHDQLPMYPPGSCPFIDESFDCFRNKRPDNGYQRYRWQPRDCNIPRWNGRHMLELSRGKRIVFVGDSLNRNMWESMVCMLRNSVVNKSNVYEASGKVHFRTEGSYSFLFTNYNLSVEFFRSTFLVQEWEMPDGNGAYKETLRIDLIDNSSQRYQKADVLIFNTGHWWTHAKTTSGKGYYQEGNHVYDELDGLEAYRRALETWARWIDSNVKFTKSLLFFRSYSPSHFRGGQWNSGGQCDNETEPIKNEKYINIEDFSPYLNTLEKVLKKMKTATYYLNITRMTDFRKDAHPSIFTKPNLTEEERRSPERFQDCTHWCLPGVPDTWNEIVYAHMLRKYYLEQKGKQKGRPKQ